jgi:TolA-binding protein
LADLERQIQDNQREIKRLADLLGEQSAALKKVVQDQKLETESTQIALKEMADKITALNERLAGQSAAAAVPAPSASAAPPAGSGAPAAQATLPPVPGGAPLPGELFSQAYADYTRGQYDLALSEFREYTKLFPDHRALRRRAVLDRGVSRRQAAVRRGHRSVGPLLQSFPSSDKLPDAYVKKGGRARTSGQEARSPGPVSFRRRALPERARRQDRSRQARTPVIVRRTRHS